MSVAETIEETTTETRKTKARGGAPKPPLPPVRLVRELEVELTDKERMERMTDLLKAMKHVDFLAAQKTLQTSEINADIKTAKRDVRVLQAALDENKEKRQVECLERHIFTTNTVEIVRTDTGATVEKRAMNLEERQATLPLGATTPKPGQPLTASIGEQLEAKVPGAGVRGVIEAREDGLCGAEIDGRECRLESGHAGSHVLTDPAPEPTEEETAITDPGALIEAGGLGEESAAPKRRRGRPKDSPNKPKN